ncbi:TOBE domain-containing protein [Streptomyces sp. H27-S2]|nr:TOBE domain-containing protein [Streptomyces sp. H27-S2]MCY0950672.1 TOBE domain-containing protein [Streptomyces sp. H27-S2]
MERGSGRARRGLGRPHLAGRNPDRRDLPQRPHPLPRHRRRIVDGPDLAAFCVQVAHEADTEYGESYTSARNAFAGIVTAVKVGDVAAQVEIQAGPHRLVSLLTREAVEELGLEVGTQATARVKSTSVHIDRA